MFVVVFLLVGGGREEERIAFLLQDQLQVSFLQASCPRGLLLRVCFLEPWEGHEDGAVGARLVCVDVLGAGAGSAGSEVLLAVAFLAPCAAGQRLGMLPASLSDLPFFFLEDEAARTQQLQAGEGEMKHTSKCTCPKQKAREAEGLPAVVGLVWGLP